MFSIIDALYTVKFLILLHDLRIKYINVIDILEYVCYQIYIYIYI